MLGFALALEVEPYVVQSRANFLERGLQIKALVLEHGDLGRGWSGDM